MAESSKLKEIRQRVANMDTGRTAAEEEWRDISEYILPRRGVFNATSGSNSNVRRGSKIVDATATRALRVLAAGMQSGLTSPSRPWFRLGLEDKDLMEYGPVRMWLDAVERGIYAALARSGFYQAMHGMYAELGAFGAADIFHESDDTSLMRFTCLTSGEYDWALDVRGHVDCVAWRTKRTVRELAARYGESALSTGTRKQLKDNAYALVEIVHFVCPRSEPEASIGPKSMPVACLVYETAGDASDILYEGGYEEFPHLCARWEAAGSDIYGNGPGHEALPDVKMLQSMAKSQLLAVQKVVNPPMRVPTGYKQRLNLIPGAQNFVNPNQPEALAPLYQINPDIQAVTYKIDDVRKAIRDAFFNDLFLMFAGDDRSNVTAAEIMQRSSEKMLMLGPVVERYQTEILDPLIGRSYGILFRAGALPPPPPEMDGVEATPEFISVLAQAQRMAQAQSIRSFVSDVGMLAQAAPQVFDKVDFEQCVDEMHAISGAPANILRSDDAYRAIAAQKQKAQAQQQAQQQMLAGVDAAQKLGKVPVSGGNGEISNAFEQMMRQASDNGGMA